MVALLLGEGLVVLVGLSSAALTLVLLVCLDIQILLVKLRLAIYLMT